MENEEIIETPVYLFLGFLESGKTKFIQETLEDERFDNGEKTLLLVFEEGIEEYDSSRFKAGETAIEWIENKEDMNVENLSALQKKHSAERILVELNGTYLLNEFFEAMPEGWMINQMMTFFDAETFLNYNQNMRQLVYDKIYMSEMIVFNRFDESKHDRMQFHKIVRSISRRNDIVYEHLNGKADMDDIFDPLPYDVKAPVIEIEDRDFAYFYRDLSENMKEYVGKTVRFKGIVAVDKRLKENEAVIGRHIMTCCEADIKYSGLSFLYSAPVELKMKEWIEIEAKITLDKSMIYHGKGPVLIASSIKKCQPPQEKVVTFY